MARVETTLHWLHLSDFHFDAGKSWDRDRSVKALLEHLEGRKKDGWRPDLVFATGDFANRGLFLVPGNHDVDRGKRFLTGPLERRVED